MRRQIWGIVGLVAGLALPCVTSGQVVYSTYAAGDDYSQGFTQVTFAGYGKNAVRFVPATSGAVDQVEVSLGRVSSAPPAAMLMIVPEVTPASGPPQGAPGTLPVWCATAGPASVDVRAIYTFTGPRGSLVGGQAYWLVIEGTDNIGWYNSSPPVTGSTAVKNGSPFWNILPTTILPALRISAVPTIQSGACCNVATGGCTVMASAACVSLGLQYNGNASTCGAGACSACPADFNHSGGLSVEDIFTFLNAWFAGCP